MYGWNVKDNQELRWTIAVKNPGVPLASRGSGNAALPCWAGWNFRARLFGLGAALPQRCFAPQPGGPSLWLTLRSS